MPSSWVAESDYIAVLVDKWMLCIWDLGSLWWLLARSTSCRDFPVVLGASFKLLWIIPGGVAMECVSVCWIIASSGANCPCAGWAATFVLPTVQRKHAGVLRMGACTDPCSFLLVTGRCARCGENVVGEGTGCTAMDQVFHVECFTCMMCNNKLRGQPFYAVEKKAYCEPCYIVSTRGFFLSASFYRADITNICFLHCCTVAS